MSESRTPNRKDRSLHKALTSRIIDEYFAHSEGWLRAILRMCIFSMTQLNGKPALVIECPNQAVAKRLSRKTWQLQQVVSCLTSSYPTGDRVLICYQEVNNQKAWRCFDTDSHAWKNWENLQTPIAPADN